MKEIVTKWTSQTQYVDIETGEILTGVNIKQEYIIVKTKKHVNIQQNAGTITYTRECRRNPQGKLKLS